MVAIDKDALAAQAKDAVEKGQAAAKDFAEKAAPVVQDVAEQGQAAAKEFAEQAAPVVQDAAGKAEKMLNKDLDGDGQIG